MKEFLMYKNRLKKPKKQEKCQNQQTQLHHEQEEKIS